MGAAAEFVKDHPFLTFFIATAAIDGVVTILRGRRCPVVFERSLEPGRSSFEITTRYPWVAVSQSPASPVVPESFYAPVAWPHGPPIPDGCFDDSAMRAHGWR